MRLGPVGGHPLIAVAAAPLGLAPGAAEMEGFDRAHHFMYFLHLSMAAC